MDTDLRKPAETWEDEPLSSLMDHIVQKHHAYCRQEVPRVESLFREVIARHGKQHPELKRMEALFSRTAKDLHMHFVREEQTLFPYIARVEQAVTLSAPVSWPAFGTVENPIRMMLIDHDQTDDELKEIRKLSANYTAPPDACPTYMALYESLKAFDQDMQEHVHAENDLLFPRAIAMEEAACKTRNEG